MVRPAQEKNSMSFGQPIARFERKYNICSDGRVWNKGKDCWQAQTETPNGYMKVLLSLNGAREQLLVHRLVALHFLPNPYEHSQVNHINGNKKDNRLENLEWLSPQANTQHALETGLRSGFMARSEKELFLNRVFNGETVTAIARSIGRGPEALSRMLRVHAERTNRGDLWNQLMKGRRRDAALRNLEKING